MLIAFFFLNSFGIYIICFERYQSKSISNLHSFSRQVLENISGGIRQQPLIKTYPSLFRLIIQIQLYQRS
jgi:uncharacterized membrane protein